MNDRFNFRAWQKTHKYMTVDISMVVDRWYYGDAEDGVRLDEDWILMQCTGLKDKNGKLIYEGDILSMHNGQYNSIVKWDAPGFYADHNGNGGSESLTTWIEDHAIIGNIYENPELLTPES